MTLDQVKALATEDQKKGDTSKAVHDLWDHVEVLDRAAFVMMIHLHEERKEWVDVIRAANLQLAKEDKDAEVLTALGNAQFMRKKPTEAKEALKKALEADKKYQPAYDALGKIYEKNNYEARLLYQDMIENFGPQPAFLTKLCHISRMDGDNEQGLQNCTQAIDKDPTDPSNQIDLALITKQTGDAEKARKLLKDTANSYTSSEAAQQEMGLFYEQEKNYVDAGTYFQKCFEINAKNERCILGIGQNGIPIQKYSTAYDAFKLLCHLAGRANSAAVRKGAAAVRAAKAADWISKFEDLSDRCALQ